MMLHPAPFSAVPYSPAFWPTNTNLLLLAAVAGALDELFPSMMSDSSTFFDDNFGELAAAAAATVDGSTFESAFSFRRRSSALPCHALLT